jgi:hypothetical protein
VLFVPDALFPHHHWGDADGVALSAPDTELAASGYFRNDPDAYSRNLQRWHLLLWNRRLDDDTGLTLTLESRGLLETGSGLYLSSDAAVPAWEEWADVQALKPETERLLQERGRGSIHDLGWRLYDMGCFVLFPGVQIGGLWTINQAKGCMRVRIADRLDLTLECIRRYYSQLADDPVAELPEGYAATNPLGPVLDRYRRFFELFGSFERYVEFWMLQDLVTAGPGGSQVRFLMPREEAGPYDFQRERGLPGTAEQYCAYLVAADDFVEARNRRLAAHAKTIPELADPICPRCLDTSHGIHQRWTL